MVSEAYIKCLICVTAHRGVMRVCDVSLCEAIELETSRDRDLVQSVSLISPTMHSLTSTLYQHQQVTDAAGVVQPSKN